MQSPTPLENRQEEVLRTGDVISKEGLPRHLLGSPVERTRRSERRSKKPDLKLVSEG
jgi:hypothetical protein